MKTFRLVSLMVLHQDEQPSRIEDIPLIDGLIINKEDGENRWIVEAFFEKSFKPIFEKAKQDETKLNLQVIISKKSNDPATFMGDVKIIKEMDNSVSVLLDGNLVSSRPIMAEIVLTDLIQQGLQGEGLLTEFKNRLQEKKKTIEN
ncbi:YwpF-like family protein [Bacillus sp. JJ1533]|uniref:YwpF-like family protein n=1 Tax=Bacillus sp. JJ1533 TaxID=3122959 RepID=UPI002FFFF1C4